MKRSFRKYVPLAVSLLFVLSTSVAMATTEAEQALGIMSLCTVISDFYLWSQGIVGLGLFIMFVGAGLAYIVPSSLLPKLHTFFGKPGEVAKNAVIGTLILFGAVVILNTLNKDLTTCNVDVLPQSTLSGMTTLPSEFLVTRKTTTGQAFYFIKAGGTCSGATACEPGFSCSNGICATAENGSLPLHSWCLVDSQCAGGNSCVSEFNFRVRPGSAADKCCAANEIVPASGGNVAYCTK